MRFLYVYPTINKPTGGLKQARMLVSLFAELGIETELLRDLAYFQGDSWDDNLFYQIPVPTAPVPFENARDYVRPDDVLIVSEYRMKQSLEICADWPVRITVYNQNGFLSLRDSPAASIYRQRIEFAIVIANYIGGLTQHIHGFPPERIFFVPYWVYRPPFDLAPERLNRQLAVAYMPRKVPQISAKVRQLVEQIHPDVPWVPIDGVPEQKVSELLRANKIFFSVQDNEGFGLPALEAMGCRSLVCGYAGVGKFHPPYATPDNGLWVPDRNIPTAVKAVSQAIDIARANSAEYHAFLKAGEQTMLQFSKQTALEAQRELVQVVSKQCYAQRTSPQWPLSIEERMFTYKVQAIQTLRKVLKGY
jgi:hypothetical protein